MVDTDIAEAVPFRTALADLIVAWNRLESTARYLVETLADVGGFEGQILTAHIGNKTLVDTIVALGERLDEDCRAHLDHFLTGFKRLTSWRNYYIHGFVAVGHRGGEAVGLINEVETKTGRLASLRRWWARKNY